MFILRHDRSDQHCIVVSIVVFWNHGLILLGQLLLNYLSTRFEFYACYQLHLLRVYFIKDILLSRQLRTTPSILRLMLSIIYHQHYKIITKLTLSSSNLFLVVFNFGSPERCDYNFFRVTGASSAFIIFDEFPRTNVSIQKM